MHANSLSEGKTSADKGENEDSSVSSKSQDDKDVTLSEEMNAIPEPHEKEKTANKMKAPSGGNKHAATVVVEKNDSDYTPNGDEEELDNTSVASSPNAAESNDTSNSTTDMHAVMEEYNETFRNAWSVIENNCLSTTTVVNNSMWPFLWPCHLDENNKLVVGMVNCNWNTWNNKVASEITHNILWNSDGTHTKHHVPKAGNDMSLVLAHLTKVNYCIFLHFVDISTVTGIFSNIYYFIILHRNELATLLCCIA